MWENGCVGSLSFSSSVMLILKWHSLVSMCVLVYLIKRNNRPSLRWLIVWVLSGDFSVYLNWLDDTVVLFVSFDNLFRFFIIKHMHDSLCDYLYCMP